MKEFLIILLVYLLVISFVAIVVTVVDKHNAQKGKRRIPEKTLLIISALGGSVAMYITMMRIRHKTQHKKFTLGIPAIMFAQVIVVASFIYLIK